MPGYTEFSWADIRLRLQERVESKPYWEDAEALLAWNEALTVWNSLTGYWHARAVQFTAANQYLYPVSASLLYRTRLTWNNLPLTPTSREDLNDSRPYWRQETTASGGQVPSRPMAWVPISLTTIYLWPADATAGNVLTFDGVAATPVLTTDGGAVNLGDELLTTLLGYALHVLSFKKGGPAFQATTPLLQAFLLEAAEENDQLKTSSIYRRAMGLDDRGLKPLRGTPTLMDDRVGRAV
jgi:hypothetical protein